jgi:hypothetical protein
MTQMRVSSLIAAAPGIQVVLTSVQLDHEPGGETREVDDEVVDGDLTVKMEAIRFSERRYRQSFRSASV